MKTASPRVSPLFYHSCPIQRTHRRNLPSSRYIRVRFESCEDKPWVVNSRLQSTLSRKSRLRVSDKRNASCPRAERLKRKKKDANASPKLDTAGKLMPEEVARRTDSSVTTSTVTLGTKEEPITVEVSRRQNQNMTDFPS